MQIVQILQKKLKCVCIKFSDKQLKWSQIYSQSVYFVKFSWGYAPDPLEGLCFALCQCALHTRMQHSAL